jgi:hypothetical protein
MLIEHNDPAQCFEYEHLVFSNGKWETWECELCGNLRTYTVSQLKKPNEETTSQAG